MAKTMRYLGTLGLIAGVAYFVRTGRAQRTMDSLKLKVPMETGKVGFGLGSIFGYLRGLGQGLANGIRSTLRMQSA